MSENYPKYHFIENHLKWKNSSDIRWNEVIEKNKVYLYKPSTNPHPNRIISTRIRAFKPRLHETFHMENTKEKMEQEELRSKTRRLFEEKIKLNMFNFAEYEGERLDFVAGFLLIICFFCILFRTSSSSSKIFSPCRKNKGDLFSHGKGGII